MLLIEPTIIQNIGPDFPPHIQIYSEIIGDLETLSNKSPVELNELTNILPSIRVTYGDGNCLYHAIAQCGRIHGTVVDKDKNKHKKYKVIEDEDNMKNIDNIYRDPDLGIYGIVESSGPETVSSLQFSLLMNKIAQKSDRVLDNVKAVLKKQDEDNQTTLDNKINSFKDKLVTHVEGKLNENGKIQNKELLQQELQILKTKEKNRYAGIEVIPMIMSYLRINIRLLVYLSEQKKFQIYEPENLNWFNENISKRDTITLLLTGEHFTSVCIYDENKLSEKEQYDF